MAIIRILLRFDRASLRRLEVRQEASSDDSKKIKLPAITTRRQSTTVTFNPEKFTRQLSFARTTVLDNTNVPRALEPSPRPILRPARTSASTFAKTTPE